MQLTDAQGAKRGIIALQLHSGGKTEVRFRNLRLVVLGDEPEDEPEDGRQAVSGARR